SSSSVFSNDTTPSQLYTLSLHDALPISMAGSLVSSPTPTPAVRSVSASGAAASGSTFGGTPFFFTSANFPGYMINWRFGLSTVRSEEHTSELQSRVDLVCRLLLEKKKNI